LNITLKNIGKRFQKEWIFQGIDVTFEKDDKVAILGGNGSGKSTLLQILSGYLTPSEGSVSWINRNGPIGVANVFSNVSLATPYMALYDEFTLKENFEFFISFKQLKGIRKASEFAEEIDLSQALNKPLKEFSSGMRQRVKLGLAIIADTDFLLLDEPSSHLDANAIKWYNDLVIKYAENRIVFVASNKEESEIPFCNKRIEILDFKPSGVPVSVSR
jgi:ABC-type multidrug transport system ATPase subunit